MVKTAIPNVISKPGFNHFHLKKICSTEAVEIGIVKQILASTPKFGNIVTSISWWPSSYS